MLLIFLTIVTAFIIFSVLPFELLPSIFRDGSLLTKLQILELSLMVAQNDPYSLIFGYGKTGVYEAITALDEKNSGFTVGHTLIGLIVELGIVALLLTCLLVNEFIVPTHRKIFWLTMLLAGTISIFPVTYLGMCVLLYNNSIFLAQRKSVAKKVWA